MYPLIVEQLLTPYHYLGYAFLFPLLSFLLESLEATICLFLMSHQYVLYTSEMLPASGHSLRTRKILSVKNSKIFYLPQLLLLLANVNIRDL